MRRLSLIFFIAVLAVGVNVVWMNWQRIQRKIVMEQAAHTVVPQVTTATGTKKVSGKIAADINRNVPFTSQAPTGVWDALHEDACEEASVAMVLRYFAKTTFASPADADRQIQKLVKENDEKLEFGPSQTAQQVAALLALENKDLRISVIADPTENTLKQALSDGYLVIIPAAARQLHNPYYQTPGPLYHMLVLRGYTMDGHVITNDPGTKRGKEFPYTWDTLIGAIHDWNDRDVDHGDKVAILIGQYKIVKYDKKTDQIDVGDAAQLKQVQADIQAVKKMKAEGKAVPGVKKW